MSLLVLAVFTWSLLKFCISSAAVKRIPGIEKAFDSIKRRSTLHRQHNETLQDIGTESGAFKNTRESPKTKTPQNTLEAIYEHQKTEIPQTSTNSDHRIIDVSYIDIGSIDERKFGKITCNYFCFYNEMWASITGLLLQDIPFLIVRLFMILHFNVFKHSMVFFTCKNIITIILRAYKVVTIKQQEYIFWREQMNEMRKYYSEKPSTYRNLSHLHDDSWPENLQICGFPRFESTESNNTVFVR